MNEISDWSMEANVLLNEGILRINKGGREREIKFSVVRSNQFRIKPYKTLPWLESLPAVSLSTLVRDE